MKIQGNKPPDGIEISHSTKKTAGIEGKEKIGTVERSKSTDKISISAKGKELAELVAAAKELPDIRVEKVEAIKKAIHAGNYNLDPLKIAEKILSEI